MIIDLCYFSEIDSNTNNKSVSVGEPVSKKSKTTSKTNKPKNTNIDDVIDKINVFRRKDPTDDVMNKFLANVYNSPLYIQATSTLISVPVPTMKFDINNVPKLKMSEQLNTTVTCKHQFTKSMQQTRSGDEIVTLFEICELCRFIKTH